jgi:hypothetical protein
MQSFTSVSGICGTRCGGCFARSCARARVPSSRSSASGPRERSPGSASGGRSPRRPDRLATTASNAGSRSTGRNRGAVRAPAAVVEAAGRDAAYDLGARAADTSDRRGSLPRPLRAQEPRATQSPADADAASHQRRRRCSGLFQGDPRLAGGQRWPAYSPAPRDRRSNRLTLPSLAQRYARGGPGLVEPPTGVVNG